MKVRRFVKWLLIDNVGAFITTISPKLNTQYCFFLFNRKFMNLDNPKTFAEKISWLKIHRYAKDPKVMRCADKFAVRDYVKEKGYGYMLNDLIAVFDDVEQIDWSILPQSFVMKWNFGSGYNLICNSKDRLDFKEAKKKMQDWGQQKFWLLFSELQYKVAHRRILCERYLDTSTGSLLDYKFYCFHGKVKAVLVIERVDENAEKAVFMTPDWEVLSDVNYKYKESFIPSKPQSILEMIVAAEKFSEGFPFVRIDFYEWQEKPIFGEMTFTPAAGINPSETLIEGKQMGEYIVLD